nr:MAG TPA: hypothetical protein [Caudoviricetes sp.]
MSTRVLRYKKSTVYGGALVENSQRVVNFPREHLRIRCSFYISKLV